MTPLQTGQKRSWKQRRSRASAAGTRQAGRQGSRSSCTSRPSSSAGSSSLAPTRPARRRPQRSRLRAPGRSPPPPLTSRSARSPHAAAAASSRSATRRASSPGLRTVSAWSSPRAPPGGWQTGPDRRVRVEIGARALDGKLVRTNRRSGLGLVRIEGDVARPLWQQRRAAPVQKGDTLVAATTAGSAIFVVTESRQAAIWGLKGRPVPGAPVFDERVASSASRPPAASSRSTAPAARSGAARERPGAVDAARQLAAEQLLQPHRDGDQRLEIDARLHALAPEQVEDVLGRDVAGRTRREGAAAEPADRCVEQRRSGLESRPRIRDPRVTRVVEMASGGTGRPTRAFTAPGVATPIVSARTTSPAPAAVSRAARSATTPGSTSPSNGHPNEQLIVAVVGAPPPRGSVRPAPSPRSATRCRSGG